MTRYLFHLTRHVARMCFDSHESLSKQADFAYLCACDLRATLAEVTASPADPYQLLHTNLGQNSILNTHTQVSMYVLIL